MIVRTLSDQIHALSSYLPGGKLFAAKGVRSSNLYKLLSGIAGEMLTSDGLIKAYRQEIIPDLTEQFIDEWEQATGIPDDCFPVSTDLTTRRTHVLIKLASLGVQTIAEMQTVVDLFTDTFTITNGVDDREEFSFPLTFPLTLDSPITTEDRFTIVIKSSASLGDLFPITFPITFGSDNAGIAECLIRKLAPVNCKVISREL